MVANRRGRIEHHRALAYGGIEQPRVGDVVDVEWWVFAHDDGIEAVQGFGFGLDGVKPVCGLCIVEQLNLLCIGLHVAFCKKSVGCAGPYAVATGLRGTHHGVGCFFVNFEGVQRVGDE